jgi:acylphosphatase
MSDEIAVRVFMSGRVQGVWYRGWTVKTATACGLRGWVRNRRDGRVEALLIGPAEAVEAVIRDCHHGPPAARVDGLKRMNAADDGSVGFDQLPSV